MQRTTPLQKRVFNLERFVRSLVLPKPYAESQVHQADPPDPAFIYLHLRTTKTDDSDSGLIIGIQWDRENRLMSLLSLLRMEKEDGDYSELLSRAAIVNQEWDGATKLSISSDEDGLACIFTIVQGVPRKFLEEPSQEALRELIVNTILILCNESGDVLERFLDLCTDHESNPSTQH